MKRTSKLSLFIAVVLLLQIGLTGWSTHSQYASAAAAGPIALSLTPADDLTNVATGAVLKIIFDENVAKGSSANTITIYEASTNTPFESLLVSNSRVKILANKNEITIDPQKDFDINTNYYVLISAGAFVNVSNGAGYAGIQAADVWNFKTVVDDTPVPLNLDSRAPTGTGVATNSAITLNFSKPVFATSGNITIAGGDDSQQIPVTSSAVQGSGGSTITITPPAALQPNRTYTITIANGLFQDELGSSYSGTSWTFTTMDSPVKIAAPFSPADEAVNVETSANLVLTFNRAVTAAPDKYIHIKIVGTNVTYQTIRATNTAVVGNVVTITPSRALNPNTSYYVVVDSGAYMATGTSDYFTGITSASVWNFTTKDSAKPIISALSPANKSSIANVNTKLQLTFDENVLPSSGNIEIRISGTGALFRSIPVTSELVTGGGTNIITIDPNKAYNGEAKKPFVNNTKYYVVIGETSFRDASGNYFGGIKTNTGWVFTATSDSTKPTAVAQTPLNNAIAVKENVDLTMTFNEAISLSDEYLAGTAKVKIFNSSTGIGYDTTLSIDSANEKKLIIDPLADLISAASYYVYIDPNVITDIAGNYYVGIQNEYQWAFKTIGTDKTPPVISKIEANESSIILTYNEELNTESKPLPGSFYVTVNGAFRSVNSVQVNGVTVVLTLSSPVLSGQLVKLSYTKGATGLIQDISLNQAASIVNSDVSLVSDTSIPKLLDIKASGSSVTLSFSKNLIAPSANAYLQFSVTIGSTVYYPIAISGNGSVVVLTVNTVITGTQSVKVSYAPGSYPLRDSSGNNVAAFSNASATSGTDNTAPKVQAITANNLLITIKYDESLNPATKPSAGQYSVLVDNVSRTVTTVSVVGDTVTLALATAVSGGQSVKVSYSQSGIALTDLADNKAAAFSQQTAESGDAKSGLLGAVAKGTTVTLSFKESLNSAYVPSSIQFTVKVKGILSPVSLVTVSGSTVKLTLSAPPGIGDAMTLSYYSNAFGLQTSKGITLDGFENVNVANQTTLLDTLSGDFESIDGGIGIKSSSVTSAADTSPAGMSAKRYSLPLDKISQAYQTARNAGVAAPKVVFEVPSTESAAIVSVPISALDSAYRSGATSVFKVIYGDISYEIPLSALDFNAIAASLNAGGSVGNLLIKIDRVSSSLTANLTSVLGTTGGQMIAGPLHFDVSAASGSIVKPITGFKGYVKRSIETYASVPTSNAAVVWYDAEAGALSYVPTTFTTSGGMTTATFKRKGNSAYALVQSSKTYSDVSSHWAAASINSLVRKYIIEGRTTTKFEPQANITRGEFATYIAKGLGLTGNKTAAAKFKDVNSKTTMGAYIGAASEAGIVTGNTDGTFKPNNPITRQEMAVMMGRAATAAGVTITLPSSASSYLSKFTDKGKISAYAQTDVAKAVFAGIMNGKTASTMSPLTNATRAEGAVMIMRLLEYVDFITP
ncbi:Ig-like domain-containing protein [Paenibacillus sp. YIM B09110]|uniref:Ig-like domain-containing protein n=1 Tax=Paenibacillus sp. YIM B09110 TaxID=3126102 RepID=UPI00301CFD44